MKSIRDMHLEAAYHHHDRHKEPTIEDYEAAPKIRFGTALKVN